MSITWFLILTVLSLLFISPVMLDTTKSVVCHIKFFPVTLASCHLFSLVQLCWTLQNQWCVILLSCQVVLNMLVCV